MPEKNRTQYAILGVLSLRPGSGYDIKKFCDKTISHYWNENFGNIYPVLTRLEGEGLIEPIQTGTGPQKKKFRITAKGLEKFQRWLELPVEYRPARSELLLKLSFGAQMPKESALRMLESVRTKYAGDLKQYKILEASYVHDEEASKDPQFVFWLLPLRFGIESTITAIKWCDEAIEAIQNSSAEA